MSMLTNIGDQLARGVTNEKNVTHIRAVAALLCVLPVAETEKNGASLTPLVGGRGGGGGDAVT
jgi:hypothetical protein